MELELGKLVPEIIVLVAACAAVLVGLGRSDATRKLSQVIAAVSLLAGLAVAVIAEACPGQYAWAASPRVLGGFFNPSYITILAMAIGFLSVLAAWDMPSKADPAVTDTRYRGEFFGMMLFSIAGVSMVGKVNDLVWLFVVLELVSIPTYILVATGRSQIIAQEAGVKYFFLGALSAAIFLFGFSYLYGATGTTRFFDTVDAQNHVVHGITWALAQSPSMSYLALIGLLMVVVGVAYKIAAVPLHFYTPDVYQGAATPVTAFLAFAPKAAGMVAIIQIVGLTGFDFARMGVQGQAILTLLSVMAVLTMTVGNVLALLQRNIKRMLAYSSIAHSGYMLVGIVAGKTEYAPASNGIRATLFYLGAYSIMNLGAFAVLIYLQGKADAGEDIDDLAGVSKEHPAAALAMAVCLFSLIGMPLTVGFLGKLYIVQAALSTGHAWLAVIVVLNAAIAAAYYLRIIAAMYLRDVWNPFTVRNSYPQRVTALVCTVAVIGLGLMPAALLNATATGSSFGPAKAAAPAAVLPAATQR